MLQPTLAKLAIMGYVWTKMSEQWSIKTTTLNSKRNRFKEKLKSMTKVREMHNGLFHQQTSKRILNRSKTKKIEK